MNIWNIPTTAWMQKRLVERGAIGVSRFRAGLDPILTGVMEPILARLPSGCVCEFGVSHGSTARFMREMSKAEIHLFDAFTQVDGIDEFLATPEHLVLARTGRWRVSTHKGLLPATLIGFAEPVSFAFVDLNDHGEVTQAVLEHIKPLLVSGASVILHDYGVPRFSVGIQRASLSLAPERDWICLSDWGRSALWRKKDNGK